jgi:tetratricopeptide (TPR) repeat protein
MKPDTPLNPAAYEFYLRAVSYPSTVEGNRIAIEMLNNSINLDPEFAPAYHESGIRFHQLAQVGKDTSEALENAINALTKALSLKKDFLPALASLALIYTDIGKHEEAHSLLLRALKINLNDPWLHFSLAYHYRYIGFLDESEKEIEIAFSIDPKNPRFRSSIVTYMFQEKYNEVLETFDLDIESPYTLNYLGEIAYRSGNKELALEYFKKVIMIKDEIGEFYFAASFTEFLKGNKKKAVEFNLMREEAEPADGEILYEIARLFGLFNAKEDCYRALKKAIDMGYFSYPFMNKDSFLISVRDDVMIKELLSIARMKHEELREKLSTNY